MGAFKRSYFEDSGFNDHLTEIIDSGKLGELESSIAKLVVRYGVDTLSEKQRHVFEKYVLGKIEISNCYRCGCTFLSSEINENDGMCSTCAHRSERDWPLCRN